MPWTLTYIVIFCAILLSWENVQGGLLAFLESGSDLCPIRVIGTTGSFVNRIKIRPTRKLLIV